jgi:LuxR family maltose regulon positive regulatory protein
MTPSPGPTEALTERELSVLAYLPTYMKSIDIADDLFLSVNTVKSHLQAIYRKLGVSSRQDAVHRARDHGLL